MKKYILSLVLLLGIATGYAQTNIVGGGGECKVDGDPDLHPVLSDATLRSCWLAADTTDGTLYVFHPDDPLGERWDVLASTGGPATNVTTGNGAPATAGTENEGDIYVDVTDPAEPSAYVWDQDTSNWVLMSTSDGGRQVIASNGLNDFDPDPDNVDTELGGVLERNTLVTGPTYDLSFSKIKNIEISADSTLKISGNDLLRATADSLRIESNNELHIKTPDVGNDVATPGQVLTLLDENTGAVDYRDLPVPDAINEPLFYVSDGQNTLEINLGDTLILDTLFIPESSITLPDSPAIFYRLDSGYVYSAGLLAGDGDAVDSIPDLSGNNNPATLFTASTGPIFDIASNATIFSSAASRMSHLPVVDSNYTCFYVIERITGSESVVNVLHGGPWLTDSALDLRLTNTASGASEGASMAVRNGNKVAYDLNNPAAGVGYIYSFSNASILENLNEKTYEVNEAPIVTIGQLSILGGKDNTSGLWGSFALKAVIVYERELSNEERGQTINYLNDIYNAF